MTADPTGRIANRRETHRPPRRPVIPPPERLAPVEQVRDELARVRTARQGPDLYVVPPPPVRPAVDGAGASPDTETDTATDTATGTGTAPVDRWERRVAGALSFLRKRITGDYPVDDYGFDPELTDAFMLPLLRPLYRKWFRVEVSGVENLPAEGSALLVGNHSGTVAMDALMLSVAVHDEHPAHRHLRLLGADFVFRLPVMSEYARKTGATLACNPDAEGLLRRGELVGVFPEGFKGVGKPFRDRYKLQRFGRGGFVSAALRTGAPIIPVSIVGAEEIYPLIGDIKPLARLLGAPYFPVTPFFPWLGPLGAIPLPSKWLIEFGPPIDIASAYGGSDAARWDGDGARRAPTTAELADDPAAVFNIADQVRETIQQTLYRLLLRRPSVFG